MLLLLLPVLALAQLAPAQEAPPPASAEATAYLDEALDLLERHFVRREEIDWDTLRRQAHERAAGARTPSDAHVAIEWAVGSLGDGHTSFRPPPTPRQSTGSEPTALSGLWLNEDLSVRLVYPGSPAERAGIERGDRIVAVDGMPVGPTDRAGLRERARQTSARLQVRPRDGGAVREVRPEAGEYSSTLAPRAYRWRERVGVLELPWHHGDGGLPDGRAYEGVLRAGIRDFGIPSGEGVCGVVVDLRIDAGGNMWPMLLGLEPLLGSGPIGSFMEPDDGSRRPWREILEHRGRQSGVASDPDDIGHVPVAVLTSGLTSSAGEAVAVAFRGRERTRSFGEATDGLATAPLTFPLPDGARLTVADVYYEDRDGRTHAEGVLPDEVVAVDWARFGVEGDAVLARAAEWLLASEGCNAGSR